MAVEFGEPLSSREMDVLQELAQGYANKEIAETLFISPNTVKVHIRNIRTKLGAASRTEAVTKAIQLNLVEGFRAVEGEADSAESESDTAIVSAETASDGPPEAIQSVETQHGSVPTAPIVEATDQPTAKPPRRATLILFAVLLSAVVVLGWIALPRIVERIAPTPTPFVEIELGEVGWLESRPLEIATSHHALASIGLDLYLVGGNTDQGLSSQTLRYNTAELNWTKLADKPTPVSEAAIAVVQGQLYVMGGRTADGSATNQLEVYSPTSDAWRPATPLPLSVAGGSAFVSGDLIYFIGGESDEGVLASAYAYDPAADGWRPLPDMPTARSHAAGGILNNRIVIAGGTDGSQALRTCEQFDIATESWLTCADMLEARAGASGTAVFSNLHVLGGSADGTVSPGESYNFDKDSWQLLNMPMLDSAETLAHLSTAPIETNIYIVGGERNGVRQATNYVYKTLPFQFFVPATSKN